MEIVELTAIQEVKADLAILLKDVVDNGASIGFLPLLPLREAEEYWENALIPEVLLFIAKIDGELAGTNQVYLEQKPNGIHRAEIRKLMVHPDFRRKGIARNLMEAAEAAVKRENRSLIVLDTREGDPSNGLYVSMQYCRAGRIPGFALSPDGKKDATILYYKELILED
ncbi:GNAT family N-acetyltransferase [Falsibacillus pallidus]|uniref:GNAT family N-acetyltransferase n=1 Tax=Falsibacillus pallidus TaxID=493781 RepID=UPI003D95FCB4